MLTQKHGKVEWSVPTKPVKMQKNCVAGGKPRKVGDVVEVAQKEYSYLTVTKAAIPHVEEVVDLGEPVVRKRKTRKKKKYGK